MTLVISKGITLDNGTRAAAIAGVSPTLDYRFAREKREIETVSLTDKLTYTGGNGTFTGSDGFIQRATTNVPRFDHDPVSRQSLGLLSEASRENLLLRSEEFDNASWAKTNITVSSNITTAPNETLTADKLVENTTNGEHLTEQLIIPAAGTYTHTVFAKAGEYNRIRVRPVHIGEAFTTSAITFDLTTGPTATTSGLITNATMQILPNGWRRCSVTFTLTSAASNHLMRIQLINAGGSSVYTGDGTSGLFIWGAQVEAASTPSTYIPTTSAAVTRTADSAVIDGTGVITGTYTMVEKPAGCAVVSGTNINLQPGFTAERVMVFPAALDAGQITAIRGAM
jgi:hypothetical protein